MEKQQRSLLHSVQLGVVVWLSAMTLCLAEAAFAGTVAGQVRCRARHNGGAVIYLVSSSLLEETKPPRKPVVLDQINLTFVPHILPVVAGTTVVFPNSDEVRHNVFSSSRAKRFNLGSYPQGASRSVTFDKLGEVALLCNVHAEMSAYVVVLETPYFAVTDRRGNFTIENVAPGQYTVRTWHERLKPVTAEITVKDDETASLELRLHRRR